MNVLVVGAGRVGKRLIQAMEHLGHDVSVVEESIINLEGLHEMTPPFRGVAVSGVPIDIDVLRSANIELCDAVAAVTNEDNINIMVAQMAKEVFGISNVIARIGDPVAKEIFAQRFGLRTVCGTNLTTQAFVAGLMHGAQADDNTETRLSIGSTTAEFISVPVQKKQVNKRLLDAAQAADGTMLFGVLRANGMMELAIDIGIVLHNGDSILYAQIAD